MKTNGSRLLSLLLAVIMVAGTLPMTVFATTVPANTDPAPLGDSIGLEKGDAIGNTGFTVTSMKTYDVAPDITEYCVTTNNANGTSQTVGNVLEANISGGNAKAVVGYGNVQTPGNWCFATTTEQCKIWENATGENVVAGINAAWFNITTGEPSGMMVINGQIVKEDNSWPYFATYSDGSCSIEHANVSLAEAARKQSEKQGHEVTVTGAVAAPAIMVENGQVVNAASGNGGYYSRTAVGIKADGTVVLFQADGTMAPRSVGYNQQEEAEMMIELGCEIVLQLDEGGSSTFVSQREGEDHVTMRNTAAGGSERGISSSILIVSQVPETGTFDHASITPDAEYYTPGAVVELNAVGIDFSGALAESIPETVTWTLADDSMGTVTAGAIDGNKASATFMSSGITGTAVIHMMDGESVVGTATVNIQNPDELYFTSNEVALNYGDVSDLGLVAKYQAEKVNLKAGDITWSMTYDEGYDSAAYPIGSFDGLYFTATTNTTVSCTVTVTAVIGELTASTSVALGKAPTIILDGGDEDGKLYNFSGVNLPDLGSTYGLNNYGRGALVSASIIDNTVEQYADIVRFGTKAIRLDFDWTAITGTDGACIGPGEALYIDGAPTAVGAWVYIPDETTPLPWLRMQISTSTNGGASWTNAYVNFIQDSGLDVNGNALKVGWNYLEADLRAYVSAGTLVRINKGMLFRAMVTTSGIGWKTVDGTKLEKSQLKGHVIVDNFCFVYGSNNQDITSPTLNSLSFINDDGSYTEIGNGMIVDDYLINLYATYADNEGTDPFATGVESAYFYIDGTYFGSGTRDNLGSTLLRVCLANGSHSITFYLKDGYGNITRETRYFTVANSDEKNNFTSVDLSIPENPQVGKVWGLDLVTDNIANVSGLTANIILTLGYPVQNVVFADGITGTFSYNPSNGNLTVEITEVDPAVVTGNVLATVEVTVPATSRQGASVNVSVKKGMYSYVTAPDYYLELPEGTADNYYLLTSSFSTPITNYEVESKYILTYDTLIVGRPGVIHVNTNEETSVPAVGVSVYAGETLLGVTDENGMLTTDALTRSVGTYELNASDAEGNLSYMVSAMSFAPVEKENAAPYYVNFNISSDITTGQRITWLSSPAYALQAAKISISTSADMSDAVIVDGVTNLVTYSGDGKTAYANAVTLTGLVPGTTYYYQVGDGSTWSEVDTFTTAPADPEYTNFFVLADIQEDEALAGFSNIANAITASGKNYAFAVQTGDAVDNVRYYGQWAAALELFTLDSVRKTDWIHVLGNHEVDDDGADGYAGKATFGNDSNWYSVEYGDVYVAVLNHIMDEEELAMCGEWLVEDAAKSDCTWKFFVTHAPVYYTNPVGGGQVYHEHLKDYIEAAGIDFFFAGNDHSYARTEPLLGGAPNSDGTVYYICGSTGGKSYSVVDNEEFYFDIATIDFTSVYLDVVADEFSVTITAYDVSLDGTVKVLDTYTKRAVDYCVNDEHTFVYDRANGTVKCVNCGYVSTMEAEMYSGFVTDKETGKIMYLVAGNPSVGLLYLDGEYLYFDNNGLAYHGEVTVGGETCLYEDGKFVSGVSAEILNAGLIGDTADFVLYKDGRLVISGTGATYTFGHTGLNPLYPTATSITSAFIGKDITVLGSYLFHRTVNCASVVFEEGSNLTKIEDRVFNDMPRLKSLVLPDKLTSIRYRAFYATKNLETVVMPAMLSDISSIAFYNATSLVVNLVEGSYAETWAKTYNVPYTTRELGEPTVFMSGSLSESVTWTLTTDGTLTISGAGVMPDFESANVTPWYFMNNTVKKVVIGKDITQIGAFSFRYMYYLDTVVFEEGSALTDIQKYAFSGCGKLANITLPEGVLRIQYAAFQSCNSLGEFYIPTGITYMSTGAFLSTTGLVLSVMEDTYAETFAKDNGIEYVTRSDGSIKGVIGDDIKWKLTTDGVLILSGSGKMYDATTTTGSVLYEYRLLIKEIVVGKDITSIGAFAFWSATNLEKVTFEEGSVLTDVQKYAFARCGKLSEIVLPETVERMQYAAFQLCDSLGEFYIPASIKYMSSHTFHVASGLTLNVEEGGYGELFAQQYGVNYVTRDGKVLTGAIGENVTWTLTTDGVLTLSGSGKMYDATTTTGSPLYEHRLLIKEVVVGKDITSIGAFTFWNATNLTKVTFEAGSALTDIQKYAFARCGKLSEIVLPDTVVRMQYAAFQLCDSLGELYIPASVKYMSSDTFQATSGLTLNVEAGSYGEVFAQQYGINYIIREGKVLTGAIGENVTWTLTTDGVLTLSGSGNMYDATTTTGSVLYEYRLLIKEVVVGKDITSIGAFTFWNATNLTKVTFEAGSALTDIQKYAFARCGKLSEIVIPETVKRMQYASFQHCASLREFYVPASVIHMSSHTFQATENVTLNVASGSYGETFAQQYGIAYTVR